MTREKDWHFVGVAARSGLLDPRTLRDRVAATQMPEQVRRIIDARLDSLFVS